MPSIGAKWAQPNAGIFFKLLITFDSWRVAQAVLSASQRSTGGKAGNEARNSDYQAVQA
jgi:hypothetical protein